MPTYDIPLGDSGEAAQLGAPLLFGLYRLTYGGWHAEPAPGASGLWHNTYDVAGHEVVVAPRPSPFAHLPRVTVDGESVDYAPTPARSRWARLYPYGPLALVVAGFLTGDPWVIYPALLAQVVGGRADLAIRNRALAAAVGLGVLGLAWLTWLAGLVRLLLM